MKQLRISESLALPLDFVTERIAFLARTGAGKSGGMRVLAEQMSQAGQFFVFLDPKGDAWGIRSEYAVLIMGGEHADVPLDARSGAFVADFLVRDRVSTVLDVSEFSEADMVRFVADFGERFYRTNRAAVHWFIDEADEFAPQSGYTKEATKCLGAIQRIQRRGRGRGIGVTVATQRSAVLNKSVLTQAGTLIAMQTTAPHDLKAVDDWLQYAATKEARGEIMSALPALKEREAFVYSPQFLGLKPQRITFARFKSFDSMRTPKHGETRAQPKRLADIDLTAVQKEMAATIEKAKAEDPRELQKKVSRLEAQLKQNEKAASPPIKTETKVIEKMVIKGSQITRLEKLLERAQKFEETLRDFSTLFTGETATIAGMIYDARKINEPAPPKPTSRQIQTRDLPSPRKSIQQLKKELPSVNGDFRASSSQQRILDSLAWLESIGLSSMTKNQIALMADQSPTSGGYFNNLGSLRSAGLVNYPTPGNVALTDVGRAAANPANVPSTNEELQNQIYAKLSRAQASILRELICQYPEAIKKDALAECIGTSPTSGGYFNNLGRLRTLKLIDYPQPGYAVATPILFLEG
jgi:uncharacterized protein